MSAADSFYWVPIIGAGIVWGHVLCRLVDRVWPKPSPFAGGNASDFAAAVQAAMGGGRDSGDERTVRALSVLQRTVHVIAVTPSMNDMRTCCGLSIEEGSGCTVSKEPVTLRHVYERPEIADLRCVDCFDHLDRALP